MKTKLCPKTLRWAVRLLRREAAQLRGIGDAEAWTNGAADSLLHEARVIELAAKPSIKRKAAK